MSNWWKVIAAVVLVAGFGVAALAWLGIWPAPSAADRERALTLFGQAKAQLQNGEEDAARRLLDESIRLAPQNSSLRMRASMSLARNDFDSALRDMNNVIGRGSALAVDYSLRCWLRAKGDGLNRARDDCDQALTLDPSLASAFGTRGLVGLRQGRNREAWEDFNTALRVGGSDEWVAWRLFGRGVAAFGQGRNVEGRQDIEMALRGKPSVAAEFAQFGLGVEIVREFDDAAYAAAISPRSLFDLRTYLYLYPNGAHAEEARTQIAEIYAWINEDQAAGQRATPGFSLAQDRGSGPASDSFGAIAISRSAWRVAFVTDYATDAEAEQAARNVCNGGSIRDCDAYAFRNVCAALAVSPPDRRRGMAWAYGQDDAVRGAIEHCRERGGRSCAPVHSQCTPTTTTEALAPPSQESPG